MEQWRLVNGREMSTQETEAETALHEANLAAATRLALLTALIDAIGVGVVLIDRDLMVAHWNKEATQRYVPSRHSYRFLK